MTRRSDTPSTPLISIWANEACTVRPVVGQEYETVYAKISRTIPSGEDLSWGDESEAFTQFLIEFSPQTHTDIVAWIDWYLQTDPGDISPGVYPLTLPGGGEIETPLVTDFDL